MMKLRSTKNLAGIQEYDDTECAWTPPLHGDRAPLSGGVRIDCNGHIQATPDCSNLDDIYPPTTIRSASR